MATRSVSLPYRPVIDAVRDTARRRLLILFIDALPLGASVVLAAAILFLICGAVAVPPLLWFFVALAGATLVAFRVHRRWLSDYQIAQIIDSRLALHDSVSTAWFLLNSDTAARSALANYQLVTAAQLASEIEPARVFPLRFGRNWLLPGGLFAVAFALLCFRYSRSGSLDLQSSVIPSQLTAQVSSWVQRAGNAIEERIPHQAATSSGSANRQQQRHGTVPLGKSDQSGQQVNAGTQQASSAKGSQPGTNEANAQASLQELERQFSPEQATDRSQSLLSRMQDALGGMIAQAQQKLGNHDSKTSQQDSQQQQSNESQGGKGSQAAKDSSHPGGQNAQSKSASNTMAQAVEKSSSATLGNDSQPALDSGNSSQSGAGRNEGQKDIRSAEELKAIGKLQQLIGKRSATITGDMSITKPSRNQELATPYSNRTGTHMDRGDEIDRDDVPPEYRDIVRAYMEAVHKQAAPSATPPNR